MDKLIQQAQALKIYQDITKKLYQILKQLQNQRIIMQSKINQLQQIIQTKDSKIRQLEQIIQNGQNYHHSLIQLNHHNTQLNHHNSQQIKQNYVQLSQNVQSQPLLEHNKENKEQLTIKNKKNNKDKMKIEINSYFKGLLNYQYQNYKSKEQQEYVKYQKVNSCDNINNKQGLIQNKFNYKLTKLNTRAQTNQSDTKYEMEDSKQEYSLQNKHQSDQNKQNLSFYNPNQTIIDIFNQFQLQNNHQTINNQQNIEKNNINNINSIQNHNIKNLFSTQLNKTNQSHCLINHIKPRKTSFNLFQNKFFHS